MLKQISRKYIPKLKRTRVAPGSEVITSDRVLTRLKESRGNKQSVATEPMTDITNNEQKGKFAKMNITKKRSRKFSTSSGENDDIIYYSDSYICYVLY